MDQPLTVVQAPGNTNDGSATWSYSTADNAFDFLADGEILTLTYTATVDDGHGGVVTKPITITVTGSNDTPEITSEAQTATISERADTHGSATPDTASGAIAFSDVDLTDTHEVTITGVHASGEMTGLANGTVQLSWLTLGPLQSIPPMACRARRAGRSRRRTAISIISPMARRHPDLHGRG